MPQYYDNTAFLKSMEPLQISEKSKINWYFVGGIIFFAGLATFAYYKYRQTESKFVLVERSNKKTEEVD